MSKHTPGPWFLVDDNPEACTVITTQGEYTKTHFDLDSEVLGVSEWLRAKPEDLRLMSAAPELLDALKLMISIHPTSKKQAIEIPESIVLGIASYAIKKAMGEK